MSSPPAILDIPLKVEKPVSPITTTPIPVIEAKGDEIVRAVLKYHNEDGRKAILAVATTIHHDFGAFNESLSVSLVQADLDKLKENENVEWFEGDGKVMYCSIR